MVAWFRHGFSKGDAIFAAVIALVLASGYAKYHIDQAAQDRERVALQAQVDAQQNEPPIFHYTGLPWAVVGGPFHVGDTVPLEAGYCLDGDTPLTYVITRRLEPVGATAGIQTALPAGSYTAPPGCVSVRSLLHQVPAETPPGHYRFAGISTYEGRYRSHQIEWSSQPFEVVP